MKEQFFEINNPLLLHSILGNSGCEKSKLQRTNGYLYYEDERHPIGRAFLEYCYSEIFNIRRFPGYENYYARSSFNCHWMVEEGVITDIDIDAACAQLKELYEFTQNYLKDLNKEALRVYRSLRPVEIDSLYVGQDDKIYMQTNIMTSYAYRPYTTYSTNVKITRTIPREDILMIDDVTVYSNRNRDCGYKAETGEYELWVLNRDKYGRISINPDDIIEDPRGLIQMDKLHRHNYSGYHNQSSADDASLSESVTAPIKPCEWNMFTKWIIRRNKRKIEDMYK